MPVILRVKGYKFWFYQADLGEPPHVHVGKDGKEAKCWLDPVKIGRSGKYKPFELREIERIVFDSHDFLLDAWQREKEKHANG